MTEICVELKCDLRHIKKVLTSKDFVFVEKFTLHDIYFTTLSIKKLKGIKYKTLIDNSVLIRQTKGGCCEGKSLIHKKKILDQNGNVVDEIKTKVEIEDINGTKQIFTNLGLLCWCDYMTSSYVYKKGNIELLIQHVNGLGTFIELEEYDSIKNKKDIEKFEILTSIINSLNLPIGNDFSCKKPYLYFKKQFFDK